MAGRAGPLASIKAVGDYFAQADFLRLIFPPQCISCETPLLEEDLLNRSADFDLVGQQILHGNSWCGECLAAVREPLKERCDTCGGVTPRHPSFHGRCRLCYASKFHFSQAVCINNYGGLMQELVIRMKGQRDERLAMQLGNILGHEMERIECLGDVDVLTPVPTHWWKKFRKGFQASELICDSASRVSRIPRLSKLLKSTRLTEKQGMLSSLQREKNVNNAFALNPFYADQVKGLTVCIIDDVMTSGSTASQCAKAIKKAGAKEVYVAVIARGARSQ